MGKILCEGCKKKCRGDVLRVGEKYFHKGCFTCSVCKRNLETGGFFMREDGFYCQDDYQKHFIAKCRVCQKDLVGEIVTVMDYSFHRECFNCTGCLAAFHPGDRVTIWHKQFFCPKCIHKHSHPAMSPSSASVAGSRGNGGLNNTMTMTSFTPGTDDDDEGCISAAADASLSDSVSPPTTTTNTRLAPSGAGVSGDLIRSVDTNLSLTTRPPCTIISEELPRQSKSILRKSAVNGVCSLPCPASAQEPGYLSTDSGLGERFGDPRASGEKLTIIIPEAGQNDNANHVDAGDRHQQKSPSCHHSTLNRSRNSLAGRVPNSDYGRFLNHSYLNLTSVKPIAPSDKDQYRRNISSSQLDGSRKSQHFHIPEAGRPRFCPTLERTYFSERHPFGRSMSTVLHQLASSTPRGSGFGSTQLINGLLDSRRPELATSAVELSRRSGRPRDASAGDATMAGGDLHDGDPEKDVFTAETRRLAAYPSGRARDPDQLAAIERYDWPAPPASAVILAELMRERRLRRKAGNQSDAGDLDIDSQDALSIDDYPLEEATLNSSEKIFDSYLTLSGIGQAILREEMKQKRHSRSRQPVDPVSASRTPNAAVEPSFRTRFSSHQFTSVNPSAALSYHGSAVSQSLVASPPVKSGHSLRPGYTGGQLTTMRTGAASLPSSSLALAADSRPGTVDWVATCDTRNQNGISKNNTAARAPLSTNLHGISMGMASRRPKPGGSNRVGCTPSSSNGLDYSSVLAPPASSSAVFHKPPAPPPPSTIPYDQLKLYKRSPPKGVDAAALETHLSDEEFHQVFRLSRPVFYRLPEWKRNDLKQRVELF